MSIFSVHTVDSAPQDSKSILQEVERNMKFIPNMLRVFSESPVALKAYIELMKLLKTSSLSEAERQVVFLETSYENDCHYCMAAHSKLAKNFKVDNAIIQAIREGKAIDDKKMETLRRFTRSVVKNKGYVKEADLKQITAVGYKQAQILEVIVAITVKTLTNFTAHVTNLPLDEAFKSEEWHNPEKK
jgi:uncharacterized peroxidase-related enzyme